MPEPQQTKRPAPRNAFKPGQSGNPGGRPKALLPVIEAARIEGPESIRVLAIIRDDPTAPSAARIAAANALLDRGFGKPLQSTQIDGTLNVVNEEELTFYQKRFECLPSSDLRTLIEIYRKAGLKLPGE